MHLVDQPPEQFGLVFLEGLAGAEGQTPLLPQLAHQPMQPATDFHRVVAVLLDQHHRLGLGRDQPLEPRLGFAGQAHVAAVHQFAGRHAVGEDVADRPRGLLDAVEQQQGHAAMLRPRPDRQRGLGHQRQRAFRPHQEPGHVETAVAQNARQVVPAMALRAFRLVLADQLGVADQQLGQPVDQFRACAGVRRLAMLGHRPSGSRPNSRTWPSASTT